MSYDTTRNRLAEMVSNGFRPQPAIRNVEQSRQAKYRELPIRLPRVAPAHSIRSCVLRVAAFCLCFEPMLHAQSGYHRVKSFGVSDLLGQEPRDALIQGSDGFLYGTARAAGGSVAGVVFRVNRDGTSYHVVRGFGLTPNDGFAPSGMTEASDGMLYGTTYSGGSNMFYGTVFRMHKDGGGYQILHSFSQYDDGQNPNAGLVEGSDGGLYGTTYNGGTGGAGTVFKLNKDGSGYIILHNFNMSGTDGFSPKCGLIKGSDGPLYGTTESGGTNSGGTIFTLNEDGSDYSIVHHFGYSTGGGLESVLLQGGDGGLYGTFQNGPTTSWGAVFRINKNGGGYTNLHTFIAYSTDGMYPVSSLVEGTNGALYGTAYQGGAGSGGTVFKVNKDGTRFSTLHDFATTGGDGNTAYAALMRASDNMLYSVTLGGGSSSVGTVYRLNQDGSGYGIIYNFTYAGGDGMNPATGLAEGRDGMLYGTTGTGGTGSCYSGCGTLYKLNKDGTGYSLLHSFNSSAGDGWEPEGGVISGQDGVLYGTTYSGGSNGFGTVFKVMPDGTGYAILHHFLGGTNEGENPSGELLQASDGMLYGTTYYGGTNYSGTVFRLSTNGGDHLVLHHFGFSDGHNPRAGLVQGSDGALFGTTYEGGSNGVGTVFRLNTDGSGYAILHHFNYDGVDGLRPSAGLVEGCDGKLYGTTTQGGSGQGVPGIVFALARNGSGYRVLHPFSIYGGDGQYPSGPLVAGNDGVLYGATAYGGYSTATDGSGTVFEINMDETGYGILHSFDVPGGEGQEPRGALLKASDGKLYGVTTYGGSSGLGTVFSLLPPPNLLRVKIVGGLVEVTFSGLSGARYQVLRSTDLTNWSVISDLIMPDAGSLTLVETAPQPTAFYRAAGIP